jgi:HTH-type transcriptional regulator/antitoxin HigA
MSQHDIKQSDFPEIGTQGVVSELLNGKRQIDSRQIRAISEPFGISPALFFSIKYVGQRRQALRRAASWEV